MAASSADDRLDVGSDARLVAMRQRRRCRTHRTRMLGQRTVFMASAISLVRIAPDAPTSGTADDQEHRCR
jgi:hypothetical protein